MNISKIGLSVTQFLYSIWEKQIWSFSSNLNEIVNWIWHYQKMVTEIGVNGKEKMESCMLYCNRECGRQEMAFIANSDLHCQTEFFGWNLVFSVDWLVENEIYFWVTFTMLIETDICLWKFAILRDVGEASKTHSHISIAIHTYGEMYAVKPGFTRQCFYNMGKDAYNGGNSLALWNLTGKMG